MKYRIIFIYVFLMIALIVEGQAVNNLRFEQSGKMVDVYYDLSGASNELFQISLYYSHDGGKTWGTSLNYVSGEVGENIKPGTNKKITWNVLKEKDILVGEVKFKVEAMPMSNCRSFIVTHTAGSIAPVTKTVTYSVVETNLSGSKKCWITQNLGADHQAISATDVTEASAGWYWQFNRKQGHKHDGTTCTPNTTWNDPISETGDWQKRESSDWLTTNDPCALLLGNGWRLPTITEWETAAAIGGWSNYNETLNSVLKLHAAGGLHCLVGSLMNRGSIGNYWSNSQSNSYAGYFLYFDSGKSARYAQIKSYGFTARCLKD